MICKSTHTGTIKALDKFGNTVIIEEYVNISYPINSDNPDPRISKPYYIRQDLDESVNLSPQSQENNVRIFETKKGEILEEIKN